MQNNHNPKQPNDPRNRVVNEQEQLEKVNTEENVPDTGGSSGTEAPDDPQENPSTYEDDPRRSGEGEIPE